MVTGSDLLRALGSFRQPGSVTQAVATQRVGASTGRHNSRRAGVGKLVLVLVVDGTWRQSDLEALVRAGWDENFYPDEMDKLVKAIV